MFLGWERGRTVGISTSDLVPRGPRVKPQEAKSWPWRSIRAEAFNISRKVKL